MANDLIWNIIISLYNDIFDHRIRCMNSHQRSVVYFLFIHMLQIVTFYLLISKILTLNFYA